MTYESRLEHLNFLRNDVAEININQTSANLSQRTGSNYHGFRTYRPGNGGRFTKFSSHRGGRRGRNRGGYFYGGNDRLICQVCGKVGHRANICNFRYDDRYTGFPPNQRTCYNNSPIALVASPSTVNDPAWYTDTGASNHITSDNGNLTSINEYVGKKKVMVGDGSKFYISHFSTTHIPALNDKSLILNKLLYVPEIKKKI